MRAQFVHLCAFAHVWKSNPHPVAQERGPSAQQCAVEDAHGDNFHHHSDYLFYERMNRNVPVDGTIATITGCLNFSVREISFHHVNGMAGGQWRGTTKEQQNFSVPSMVLFFVAQASIKDSITSTMHCIARTRRVSASQEQYIVNL